MKHQIAVLAAVALSIGFVPTSLPQTGEMDAGHDMKQKSTTQAHRASGTVTKVDQAGSKVTIAHGSVESLKWPAMTMNFIVKDKALLGKFSQGKKLEFEFVKQGSDYVITSAK